MRALPRIAAFFAAVAVPVVASAQTAPVAPPEPAPAPAPVAAPAPAPAPVPVAAVAAEVDPTLDRGQDLDPNIDRTFLLPTAQTQPKGSVSFNDYELIFLGLTYGVTNDFQITGTTMVPLGDGAPFFGVVGGKYRIVKSGRLRVAAQGNLIYARSSNVGDGVSDSATAGTLGGIASICIDDGCESLISASVQAGFAIGEDNNATPFLYGGSIVQKISPRVKLLVEAVSAGAFGDDDFVVADGALVSYGVRFVGNDIAGDVGFVKPIIDGDDGDVFPMGFPFVSFTYRHR